MHDNQQLWFKDYAISLLWGLCTMLLCMTLCFFAIRSAKLQWSGRVFGDEQFNWKDGFFVLSFVAVFLFTVSATFSWRHNRRT